MSHADPNHWIILRMLKETPRSYVSGTLLASLLGVSRAGIWKHIQTLRSMGYEISSHPKEGYRLEALPDRLIPEEVILNLHTNWLGRNYHYHEEVTSTNDQALELASRGAPHGAVVVAEKQTAGKGRLSRSWESPFLHGLYVSLLLRLSIPTQEAPQCNLLAALAFTRVLSRYEGITVTIKWPNDVLINGKKAVGILTEMQSDQDMTRFLVVGMGLNVNHTAEDLDPGFRYPATSLALEVGHPVMRQALLIRLLSEFESLLDRYAAEGFSCFLEELEQHSYLLGREVLVQQPQGDLRGVVMGFTREGALRLKTADGNESVIWAGDVSRLDGS